MTPPPSPLGVKNVKIRENSEKIRGPSATLLIIQNIDKFAKNERELDWVRFG